MDFRAGTVLQGGKYVIHRVLEQSRLSLTLQAMALPSRPVILQTLKPELQAQRQYAAIRQQFLTQVTRLAQCNHPALVQWLATFEENNLPFAVLDYTPGRSLAEIVQTTGALPLPVAIRSMQQVGAALQVLHRQGLVHHHVSPQNMVMPEGSEIVVLVNITLITAGMLAATEAALLAPPPVAAAIAQAQPPGLPTPATDVYGLAATLYFLLTQRPPIAAPLRAQTAIVAPRQFNPQISPALETAILQGLELTPQARPELSDWLATLATVGTPVSLAPPPPDVVATSDLQPEHPPLEKVSHSLLRSPDPPMLSASSKRFSGAIVTTAAISAAIGIGTGLALRLAATTTGTGTSFFNSRQAFPTLDNWPGESLPLATPTLPASPPARVTGPRIEREVILPPRSAPELPTPAPEVMPAIPEAAPVVPPPTVSAPVPEFVSPPAASPPNAIAPEAAPLAPPPLAEPAPPPPVSPPAPPSVPTN